MTLPGTAYVDRPKLDALTPDLDATWEMGGYSTNIPRDLRRFAGAVKEILIDHRLPPRKSLCLMLARETQLRWIGYAMMAEGQA